MQAPEVEATAQKHATRRLARFSLAGSRTERDAEQMWAQDSLCLASVRDQALSIRNALRELDAFRRSGQRCTVPRRQITRTGRRLRPATVSIRSADEPCIRDAYRSNDFGLCATVGAECLRRIGNTRCRAPFSWNGTRRGPSATSESAAENSVESIQHTRNPSTSLGCRA